jgi:hypothetical protein
MTENDENFEEVYLDVLNCTRDMLEAHDAMAVAGAMIAQALSIYKTTLSAEEFEDILNTIVTKKDLVKSFAPRNVH